MVLSFTNWGTQTFWDSASNSHKKYLFVTTLRSSWDPGGKSFTCRTIPSIAQLSCHQHIGISYKTVSVKGLPRRYWILTPDGIETCAPWTSVAIPSNIGFRFVAMGELRHILRKILTVCCQITSFKQNLLLRTGACCEIWIQMHNMFGFQNTQIQSTTIFQITYYHQHLAPVFLTNKWLKITFSWNKLENWWVGDRLQKFCGLQPKICEYIFNF